MEDLYINFTVLISKINKVIQRIKSFEIAKYGLQPIHVSCSYYLSKNPQGLTAKELSAMTLEDKAAISRALKTLNEKGFVQYAPGGRNEIVKLTKEGMAFTDIVSKKIKLAVDAGSVKLTEKEHEFFYSSLIEIANNLSDYYQKLIKK